MARFLALIITGTLVFTASGCGDDDGGESLVQEDSLRNCLADAGLADGAENNGSFLILLPAPDFVVHSQDGTDVSVNVYGTEEKAERAAADAGSVTRTLGHAVEVSSKRNVVLIFNPPPSDSTRKAAERCLD